jgi:hypothetical protein
LSGILNTIQHNVSETGSVSVLRWVRGTYSVRSKNPVILSVIHNHQNRLESTSSLCLNFQTCVLIDYWL